MWYKNWNCGEEWNKVGEFSRHNYVFLIRSNFTSKDIHRQEVKKWNNTYEWNWKKGVSVLISYKIIFKWEVKRDKEGYFTMTKG
jgi:hypothetical protein